jgi:hypothetical protein
LRLTGNEGFSLYHWSNLAERSDLPEPAVPVINKASI